MEAKHKPYVNILLHFMVEALLFPLYPGIYFICLFLEDPKLLRPLKRFHAALVKGAVSSKITGTRWCTRWSYFLAPCTSQELKQGPVAPVMRAAPELI